jgi:hypothetical protein
MVLYCQLYHSRGGPFGDQANAIHAGSARDVDHGCDIGKLEFACAIDKQDAARLREPICSATQVWTLLEDQKFLAALRNL